MQATPLFLGACALASIAGVVSGATINTRPIQHAGIGMEEIVRPAIQFGAAGSELSEQVSLPDHYAMRTPEGIVEVGELSMRGIYAQRRFGWRQAQWAPPPEPSLEEPQAEPGWSYAADVVPADPAIVPASQPQPQTPQPQDAFAPSPSSAGDARTIDVEFELASR
ncbi:hypothetical protein GCM10011515_05520 [Tsuneonella deserti]|uniref:Uncharacterized protein n=1 Tax=Tsuneonella deserti TaxID=2035528 RepID=A0ABQ1S249_9SPHN|nr:hypothetical protein [Tsuneonella deserti]GGD88740.1 hypothetical protein GCM10011515_05520 [Tsuneonella deserti]